MKNLCIEKMKTLEGGKNGQATAACLQDAYSNYGWVSVWAVVQSAFIPQTAAALALTCAANNL